MALLQHISTGCRFRMLQSKTLHSYPGSCLEFSQFPGSLHFKKIVTVKVANQASLPKHCFKLSLACTTQHKLRNGLTRSVISTNRHGGGLSFNAALGRRLFSNVSTPVILNKSSNKVGNNLSVEISRKREKQAKSLTTYGKDGMFNQDPDKSVHLSRISVAKDIGMTTSKEELEGGMKGVNLDNSAPPRKKQSSRLKSKVQQQPESKNSVEQAPELSASSGSTDQPKRSRKSSNTKRSTTEKLESILATELSASSGSADQQIPSRKSSNTEKSTTEKLESIITPELSASSGSADQKKRSRKLSTTKKSTTGKVESVLASELSVSSGSADQKKFPINSSNTKKSITETLESILGPELSTSSGSADQQKRSKKSSKIKKSTTEQLQSIAPSKNSAVTNASSEVLVSIDGSTQVAKNSKGRRKSKKEASSQTESNQSTVMQPGNKLSQNKQPQMFETNKQREQKTFPQLYPPISKSVVIVESVTKAKVIQGYLGDMYEVLPSYGHVRDLAARSGSVRPDDDFSMVWEVTASSWTHIKSMKVALSGAKNIILASDPDREGEAIAWHIVEMLRQQDALREDVTVSRVVFTEITETSIKSALQSPRHIDIDLVNAYLARRALDYLIGFSISPLLWRKLPGCQSAGRVQSAALSLLCDRESEIDDFKPQEYWSVEVKFQGSADSLSIQSDLTHLNGKKLDQFAIGSNTEADDIKEMVTSSSFEVLNSKRSQARRNSPMPFITSTLQQDASNKLGFSAASTMKLAQKLYEGVQLSEGQATGLITYMRTDGLHISGEAEKEIQSFVKERYGHDFAVKGPRKYSKTVKNAQEAHEAIRPTNIRRLPSTLVSVLDEDSLKLYTLIWSRTLACQMESAIIDQIQLDIGNSGKSIVFRSSCSKVAFLGFQAVREDVETSRIRVEADESNQRNKVFQSLSNLKLGESLSLNKVELKQHHTQPPPRYSEGSLIKKLEELGIGRPSTYASTIKVLKDRNYVTVKGRTLFPEFRGRMVSAYLSHYFSEVADYSFTADMENELDNVSGGLTEWKGLVKDYWTRFSKYCEHAGSIHIHQVEKMLEKAFSDFLFSSLPGDSRTCPSCSQGKLIFKVSRFGAGYFIGCDQHPQCKYIAKTLYGEEDEDSGSEESNKVIEEPKLLGLNAGTSEKVLLKNGPYGFYVQLGEDRKGHSPKRASVSQVKDVNSITLEDALELLRYPISLGNHPDDGQPVMLKLARFGFSIRHRRTIAPVPKNMKGGDITLEKALKMLQGKDVKRCGRPKRVKVVEEPKEAAL